MSNPPKRRSAKTKFSPCVACLAYGNRCSESRPCKRCTKLSRNCVGLNSWEGWIERPLARKTECLHLTQDKNDINKERDRGVEYFEHRDWGSQQLKKLCGLGHSFQRIREFVKSISFSRSVEISNSLQKCRKLFNHFALAFGREKEDLLQVKWDVVDDFLCIAFDPKSRTRRRIVTNPHAAFLLEMHHEEYLARSASNELPAPCTETDGFLIFISMCIRDIFGPKSSPSLYIRMCSGGGSRAFLACQRNVNIRDNDGLVSEVHWIFREVEADEYDRATVNTPECCPLYALGDRRTGRQLLADFAADRSMGLAGLARSTAGAALLAGLPRRMEALAADFAAKLSGSAAAVAGAGGGGLAVSPVGPAECWAALAATGAGAGCEPALDARMHVDSLIHAAPSAAPPPIGGWP